MAFTDVAICNLALSRIGITLRINSISPPDATQEADTCSFLFPLMRDMLLEEHQWPFAVKRDALALVEELDSHDWDYAYRYPNDCMRAIRIKGQTRAVDDYIPFEVSADDAGRLILTDEENAELKYVRRWDDESQYPSLFASALAWKIAMEAVVPLGRDLAIKTRAEAGYEVAVTKALATAFNEEEGDRPPKPQSITARL